jgi:peptidyl-prolyl cis-trans isomerase B (cyclophilin B)
MAIVIMKTNLGSITIEVDEQATPKTAENFLNYCLDGFYTNTIFHRVIDRFMIQGGGMNADLSSKPNNKPIVNEAKTGLKNVVGTVAMARTSDPHSATSQFFINVANNDFLNFKSETVDGWGYCAFGKVTAGMDVVTKISHVNTVNRGSYQDVPEENIVIESVEVVPSTVASETATV